MTKPKMITLLSTVVLATASTSVTFADEIVSDGTSLPEVSQVLPTEPTQPIETPTDPVAPTDPVITEPSTPPTTEEPPVAEEPTPPSGEQGKDDAGDSVDVPDDQPKTTDQANEQGASQVGTVSSSTGQVVQNVTTDAPVQTNTGAVIISTQNGQLVLSDGSTVTPEAIGAVTNADKTISVTQADGTQATLPETGEEQGILGLLGSLLLGGLGYYFRQKRLSQK